MKIIKSILAVFSVICCLNTFAIANESYQFEVLSTTDMHGRATKKDVATQKEDFNSMVRAASVVKNERKTFGDKMLVIDNGDLIQGTLLAQYAITVKPQEENPMITALKYINYDIWVMGNHEFNYSPMQRDTQIKNALKSGIAVLGGNIVLKNDGKNIHNQNVKKGSPYYDPYTIKTFDFGNGKKVRVAVIGLGNANNAAWDREANYENLQFNSFNNPNGYLEVEIANWVNKIKKENLADIIIVSVHSGKTTDDGVVITGFLKEAQAVYGTKKAKGIDMLIYGHDHRANIEKVTTADNKEIYIVNGGGTTVTKNVITVNFDNNNKFAGYTIDGELIPLKDYAVDKALNMKLNPWYLATYAWASKPLGKFANGWNKLKYQAENKTNDDLVLEQNEINNLVHKAQIWSSWRNYESDGIEGATVSITSSAVAKKNNSTIINFVPKDGDKISILNLALIYRYANNMVGSVDMTPKQLYAWMNVVANNLDIGENGKPTLKKGVSLYGIDTFYGIDYQFDLTKPVNSRIVYAKINGVNLLDIKKPIRVVLNSYRLAGEYGFKEATGITGKDLKWTAIDYFNDEQANLQAQLGDYVKFKGKIIPYDTVEHSYNSTWSIITK